MQLRKIFFIPIVVFIVIFGFALSCGGQSTPETSKNKITSGDIEDMRNNILNRFDYISQIEMSFNEDENTLYCEFKISSQPESEETILKSVYAQLPVDDFGVNLYLGILDSTGNELGYLTCINGSVSVKKL